VLTVLALGGNALLRKGERGSAAEQREKIRETIAAARELFAAGPVVVTHGNGPQVGNELLRQEAGAGEAPQLPLWLTVALTQGEIGSLLAAELRAVLEREAAVVLTHVEVDPDDPAFAEPTKPVGALLRRGAGRGAPARAWLGARRGLRPRLSPRRPLPRADGDPRARCY
jgi:carbamate kinase